MTTKYVLAISGNDIFSGGGLHADLTTYAIDGLHGFVAVTCLTAMTEKGFEVFPIETDLFDKQLSSLNTVDFSSIKLGLLPNAKIAELSLDFIKAHQDIPVVLDPVLVCKEKHDISVNTLRDELIKFFPYTTIITPNLVEAEILSQKHIATLDDVKDAAKTLYDLGAKMVVIKGGNRLDKEKAIDVVYDGKDFSILEADVQEQNNVGAGCTFASSIASNLALGQDTLTAVKTAKDFVYKAISHADQYGVAQHYDK